jgi:DNA-binding MarR family transcriptional regulator
MKIENEIKQNIFPNEYVKTQVNFLLTSSFIDYRSKLFFKKFGISPQQYNVLRILRGNYPLCSSSTYIMERMIDKQSNASRLIAKLESKKLIDNKQNIFDKRQSDICINKNGLILLENIDEVIDTEIYHNYKDFSEYELKLLNSFLDRIRG